MRALALALAEHVLLLTPQIDLFFGKSKLHTGTDLSTMEAEVIVLAHSCRELFPVVDMAKDLSGAVGLLIGYTTMNVFITYYNAGALVLLDTLPLQLGGPARI